MESMYLYSPSTRGFYPRVLQPDFVEAGTWPNDLVEVADEDYERLMRVPSDGLVIVSGENGYPETSAPPPLSADETKARNVSIRDSLLATAALRIAPLQDAIELELASQGESEFLLAWRRYRVDVNRVDVMVANPSWPPPPQ